MGFVEILQENVSKEGGRIMSTLGRENGEERYSCS